MEATFYLSNTTKIYQFKAKNSEISDYAMPLENSSKNFKIDNMKKTNKQDLKEL